MRKCPGCGKSYELPAGAPLPAHPDVRWYPVFRWCVFGDRSGAIVGVTA